MAFDPVPWAVGGGAVHSSEVARLMTYLATGGQEGVLGSLDLAVSPLAVPGTGIRVAPGACVIRNRASGTSYDTYAARMPSQTTLTTTPNGPSAPRSDLILARVENPFISGEPWSIPSDVTVGPYVFARIVQGVPITTRNVASLNLGYSGIALARIDYPINTGTVTAGMIKDLRCVTNPAAVSPFPSPDADDEDGGEARNYEFVNQPHTGGNDIITYTATTYQNWPTDAVWSLRIPWWATHMEYDLRVNNAQVRDNNATGNTQFVVNGVAVKSVVFDHNLQTDTATWNYERVQMPIAGEYVLPPALRGTTITCRFQAKFNSGDPAITNCKLVADNSTYTGGFIFFHCRPVLV
jgi:hypothetical protein